MAAHLKNKAFNKMLLPRLRAISSSGISRALSCEPIASTGYMLNKCIIDIRCGELCGGRGRQAHHVESCVATGDGGLIMWGSVWWQGTAGSSCGKMCGGMGRRANQVNWWCQDFANNSTRDIAPLMISEASLGVA